MPTKKTTKKAAPAKAKKKAATGTKAKKKKSSVKKTRSKKVTAAPEVSKGPIVTPPVVSPPEAVKSEPAHVKVSSPKVSPKKDEPQKPIKKISPPDSPRPETKIKLHETPKPQRKEPILEPKASPKPTAVAEAPTSKAEIKKLPFNEMMTVKNLSEAMDVKVADVIKKLMSIGTLATINQRLEADVAALVADEFGFKLVVKSIYTDEAFEAPEDEGAKEFRPPVVTVMGHVDHGKTSLLDAIRQTSVVDKEAGGITQHIGAYQVKTEKGVITFLDTPGHEAFTAMRARGANATDIVILVVAADDSVMPQTIEAIDHAKAANVPIVVAINKVDLPTANVQKVKQELAQYNLQSEDWGGKTVMVEVSAKTKHNIDKLFEMVLLEAELLELKANPKRPARGVVLEARLDSRQGVTTTALVQAGTLRVGDVIVCGLCHGRIRAMLDEHRKPMEKVGPSGPVAILGLSQVPEAGDQFSVVSNDREAREIAERRQAHTKEMALRKSGHLSLESLHSKIAEGKVKDLPVIIKADVQGSLQAIQDALGKLSSDAIKLKFVHVGVGVINESDVLLAEAADAIVFGFHVETGSKAETEAKRAGVDIRSYKIIYEMVADVRAAMEGLLQPEEREVTKGRAEVKKMFPSSRYGAVAGSMVVDGKITRGNKGRVLRGSEEVARGTVVSIRRFKDDVKEVDRGYECGISIEGIKSYKTGDIIEAFVIEKHARRLDA